MNFKKLPKFALLALLSCATFSACSGEKDNRTEVVFCHTMGATNQEYLNAFQVVGTTSYGTGIAQTTINLSNGASLKYTFAKVYDPGGEESIHQKGITPDIEIPLEKYTNGDALSYYTSNYNQLKEAVRLGVILGE